MVYKEFGLISIIMAAYNSEKTIEQAINSVLNQTYPNFELLVVDDCSKDGTVKVVESLAAKDCRVRLIFNEKNSGVSYTRKHGLKEAKGAWIAILDSDDAWAPEKLEKQIKELEEEARPRMTFSWQDQDKQTPICFSPGLRLWIQMVVPSIGIFMLQGRLHTISC